MNSDLEKIVAFIDKHHVMSLATYLNSELSVCNLFYAYDAKEFSFVVASSDDTKHIQHILKNKKVAGSIVLETKTIGKIQGLQFEGSFFKLEDSKLKKLYFKTFPYAIAMNPKLWKLRVKSFKLTDNSFGFGKKVFWKDS